VTEETKISFDKIDESIGSVPGIYEIWMRSDTARPDIGLKAGISINGRKRLKDHVASRDSGLKWRTVGNSSNPDDCVSKKSILAKHLYFDKALTAEFDLTTEADRRRFLLERCYIIFTETATKAEARELEIKKEQSGIFRYTGKVVRREI
jgi:hypothetical protein